MGIPRWPDMGKISLVEGIAFLLELRDSRGHVDGIPDNDGIGDQIQATGLMSQHLTTGMTQVALIRNHQECSEVVQRLAFVQLPQDPPPILGFFARPPIRYISAIHPHHGEEHLSVTIEYFRFYETV
jgi:hypothetical protein